VFYAIGLSACGVPMGVVVGFVIGFFNLIPFMSYVLGLPLALVLSWVDDQSLTRLLVVAAVFTFGQFVEGNFITPRIVGQSIGLHAVVIMLAVLVGGTLFGFVGMLLAMPVTATLSVFWADLREAYLKSAFFHGNAPPPAPWA
jgi:predicted PurR-regulated permease PerM